MPSERRVRTGVSNIAKLFDLGERASDTVRPAFENALRVSGVPSGGYNGTGGGDLSPIACGLFVSLFGTRESGKIRDT